MDFMRHIMIHFNFSVIETLKAWFVGVSRSNIVIIYFLVMPSFFISANLSNADVWKSKFCFHVSCFITAHSSIRYCSEDCWPRQSSHLTIYKGFKFHQVSISLCVMTIMRVTKCLLALLIPDGVWHTPGAQLSYSISPPHAHTLPDIYNWTHSYTQNHTN